MVNIGTTTKSVLVEVHNSIGIIERYYGPLQYIITSEILGIDKDIVLQMAFKAINDSIRLNGLIPTLLVFGVYP
jgi:hypothetical protein